jgi:hypothetical protein
MGYEQVTVGGQDSIVDTVTRYGLDGPGMKTQWGQDFVPSRLALRTTQLPVQWVIGLPQR